MMWSIRFPFCYIISSITNNFLNHRFFSFSISAQYFFFHKFKTLTSQNFYKQHFHPNKFLSNYRSKLNQLLLHPPTFLSFKFSFFQPSHNLHLTEKNSKPRNSHEKPVHASSPRSQQSLKQRGFLDTGSRMEFPRRLKRFDRGGTSFMTAIDPTVEQRGKWRLERSL